MMVFSAEDYRFITYAMLSEPASPDDFRMFFDGECSNVEVRLEILLRKHVFSYEKGKIILSSKSDNLFRPSLLFEGTGQTLKNEKPVADSNILMGIINLLTNSSIPFREANIHHFLKSGSLTKIFPQFGEDAIKDIFLAVRSTLIKNRTVFLRDENLAFDKANVEKLLRLSPLSFALYCLDLKAETKVSSAVSKALSLLKSIPSTERGFIKMLKLYFIRERITFSPEEALEFLETMSVIIKEGNTLFLNPSILSEKDARSPFTCDSDLCVSYTGSIESNALLYRFANIVKCDKVTTYRINKESFSRAVNSGLTGKDILEYLNTQAYTFQFGKWAENAERLEFFDGVILRCTIELDSVIEKLPNMQGAIVRKIGPCFYLVKREKAKEIEKALCNSFDLCGIKTTYSDSSENRETDIYATPFEDWVLPEEHDDEKYSDGVDSVLSVFSHGNVQSCSGIDFSGKLNIIKNAVKKKNSILLIDTLSSKDVVKPLELLKTNESDFTLSYVSLLTFAESSIKVGSIYEVSAIQLSISSNS